MLDRVLNLAGVNQQQFWTRHLANKLFARWEEFNEAAGFPIDLDAFSTVADNRAAIAVYDIGKLDLMLIAPMGSSFTVRSTAIAPWGPIRLWTGSRTING